MGVIGRRETQNVRNTRITGTPGPGRSDRRWGRVARVAGVTESGLLALARPRDHPSRRQHSSTVVPRARRVAAESSAVRRDEIHRFGFATGIEVTVHRRTQPRRAAPAGCPRPAIAESPCRLFAGMASGGRLARHPETANLVRYRREEDVINRLRTCSLAIRVSQGDG